MWRGDVLHADALDDGAHCGTAHGAAWVQHVGCPLRFVLAAQCGSVDTKASRPEHGQRSCITGVLSEQVQGYLCLHRGKESCLSKGALSGVLKQGDQLHLTCRQPSPRDQAGIKHRQHAWLAILLCAATFLHVATLSCEDKSLQRSQSATNAACAQ